MDKWIPGAEPKQPVNCDLEIDKHYPDGDPRRSALKGKKPSPDVLSFIEYWHKEHPEEPKDTVFELIDSANY
jgi:hypothetical protein